MKLFNKNSNSDTTTDSAKRDVTITAEAPRLPSHVVAETDDARWKIPLTLDEQYHLAHEYERGVSDEARVLRDFLELMYQGSDGGAVRLTVEIKLEGPGEVSLVATPSGHGSVSRAVAPSMKYADVGRHILGWVAEAQTRPDLVADLVASLADEQE
ncbi:hypothetical protein HHL24_17115 [Paraburkholderia sp. RP-4-7]|uniref:Uncharacterized protein n=1 Tax=Paraburkholderia polaris TaxID=2728848 RepID=A0A848IE51_9BURK|nr:hypothetical protein [Paraburkholderia polaris]NML99649.1 hypothetical protein [Paraburkholderia polaris]